MKMKTINKILISISCLFSVLSCSFLEVEIQNVTTEDNYYRNEGQLIEALDGVYAILNESYLYGNHMLGRMGLSADLGYEYYKKDANTVEIGRASCRERV